MTKNKKENLDYPTEPLENGTTIPDWAIPLQLQLFLFYSFVIAVLSSPSFRTCLAIKYMEPSKIKKKKNIKVSQYSQCERTPEIQTLCYVGLCNNKTDMRLKVVCESY